MKKTLEIVLVGTGFYVCGKNKKEYGTILPAIFSFAKLNQINVKIIIELSLYHPLKTTVLNLGSFFSLTVASCIHLLEGDLPSFFLEDFKSCLQLGKLL